MEMNKNGLKLMEMAKIFKLAKIVKMVKIANYVQTEDGTYPRFDVQLRYTPFLLSLMVLFGYTKSSCWILFANLLRNMMSQSLRIPFKS